MQHWQADDTAALDRALASAAAGSPTVLVIDGAAGMGKSALLDELSRRASGFAQLWAEGRSDRTAPDYGALQQWGADIDPAAAGPVLAAQQLRALLSEFGDRPVMLVADDAQWIDAESAEAVLAVLRRAAGDRLLCAIAVRSDGEETPRALSRIAAGPWETGRIALSGLNAESAAALCREIRPDIGTELIRTLVRHTAGNPLYLRALLAEHDVAELSRTDVLPAPAQFAELVAARCAALDSRAVALLRSAAVLGDGWITVHDATAVAGDSDSASGIGELAAADLVRLGTLRDGPSVRISHGLVRAAVYQQTPLPVRRALHRAAAQLASSPGDRLDHLVAAAEQFDDALADELESHAQALHDQRAHRMAGRYMRSASAATRDPIVRERRWLDALLDMIGAGELDAVTAELPAVARAQDSARAALVRSALAIFAGRRREGLRILAEARDASREPPDPIVDYRLNLLEMWGLLTSGSPPEHVQAALARLDRAPIVDRALQRFELTAREQVATWTQPLEQILAGLGDLPAHPAAAPLMASPRLYARGSALSHAGFVGEAMADLSEITRRIQAGEIEFGAGSPHGQLARNQWFAGDWALSRMNFGLALDLSWAGPHPILAGALPITAVSDGDLGRADELIHRAEAQLSESAWIAAVDSLAVSRVIRWHAEPDDGRRAAVFDPMRATVDAIRSGRVRRPSIWLMHAAIAAIWANDRPAAELCIDRLQAEARPDLVRPAASWLRGLLAEARGKGRAAAEFLHSAARDMPDALPLYRAHVLADHARMAHLLGDLSTAESALAEALGLYRRLGAALYVDRLAAIASPGAASGRPAAPSAATHAASGFGLSDREEDVLTLVVRGLSYAQIARELFITQSTVSYHLSRIYAKTGVSSRHQLSDLMAHSSGV